MSTYAANPQTQTGTGGGGLQPDQQLSQDLVLPGGPPAGAYTDAQYLAQEAQLRDQITQQYNDYLQQLGYVNPKTGAYIPGSVVQNAQLQEDQLNEQRRQAILQNTQQAQQNGILFSGMRGTLQAQAESPFEQQIGGIELSTPQTLAQLYGQAADLVNQYNTQNQSLLADAAARATAAIDANPTTPAPATGGTGGTGGTGSTDTGGVVPVGIPSDPTTVPVPSQPVDSTPLVPGVTSLGPQPGEPPHPFDRGDLTAVHAFARGGEIDEPTFAQLGERAMPGVRRSHEVVIPRHHLTESQNRTLDRLMAAAKIPNLRSERGSVRREREHMGPGVQRYEEHQPAAVVHIHTHPQSPLRGEDVDSLGGSIASIGGVGAPPGIGPVDDGSGGGIPHGFGPGGAVTGVPPVSDVLPHGGQFPGLALGRRRHPYYDYLHLQHRLAMEGAHALAPQAPPLPSQPVGIPPVHPILPEPINPLQQLRTAAFERMSG